MKLYSRIYELDHLFDSETEHSMLLECDVDVQRDCYSLVKNTKSIEVGEMKTFVIMNDNQLSVFNKLTTITGIKYKLTDITEDSILGNYTTENEDVKSLISSFLEENLTIDLALDKINLKGIESLSEIDIKILKQI